MQENIKAAVRRGYGDTAQAGLGSHQASVKNIAKAFGYSAEELASIPAKANMGLSCGNPVATASLQPGETVLDLGSGGGLDVFLAAQKVGPTGQAIGIDMTGEMIELARANAEKGRYTNVRFLLGEIEAMPLPDQSVDCVISNCVINLVPDKPAALREIFRVLKPGGRLAISDIVLRKPLPADVAEQVAAWTGCIAGAMPMDDVSHLLQAAGFESAHVQETGSDLNAYAEGGNAACCAPAEPSLAAPSVQPKAAPANQEACCEPDPSGQACCAPLAPKAQPKAQPKGEEECDPASGCCGPAEASAPSAQTMHDTLSEVLTTFDVNEYAASVRIFALKP